MAKTPKLYRRLTRNAASVGSYSSLWLAADHLMIVRSTGYHESYQRLQLSELKGVFLTATGRRMWWAIVWGVIAGCSGLVVLMALFGRDRPMFSLFFLVLGIVGLVWNHLVGEGCRAYVLTGVQTVELTPLFRLPKARRVLGELQPLIAAAQADLVTTPPPSIANPSAAASVELSSPSAAEPAPPPPSIA